MNRHATLAEGERCGCFTPSYVLFMTITNRKSMSEMAAVNVRSRDRSHDSAIDSIFDQTGWKACLTRNVCVRSSGRTAERLIESIRRDCLGLWRHHKIHASLKYLTRTRRSVKLEIRTKYRTHGSRPSLPQSGSGCLQLADSLAQRPLRRGPITGRASCADFFEVIAGCRRVLR